ncbi:hypothetical protein PMIN03_009004 [Paraphaeosphaeria minitans]
MATNHASKTTRNNRYMLSAFRGFGRLKKSPSGEAVDGCRVRQPRHQVDVDVQSNGPSARVTRVMAILGKDDRCSLTHAQCPEAQPTNDGHNHLRPPPPALARTIVIETRTLTALAAGA